LVELTRILQSSRNFENNGDPFSVMDNANHINSVAGVLKSYFRKLDEALFSETYFDQLMNITRYHGLTVKDKDAVEKSDFVLKIREVLQQWSDPCIVVTRYLFSFLHDLAKYSEETQMDPFNLAICFGPSLCPIPDNKDLVQHTNLVNDLIKTFIMFCHEIFNFHIEGPVYISVSDRTTGASAEEKEAASIESVDLPQTVQYAVAVYDFTSETAQAPSFCAGDTLVLYSQASQDWWRGNKDGEEGLIAASYIRLVSPEELAAGSDQEQEQSQLSPDYPRKLSDDGIISKLPSFKSNIKMWEQKTLDRKTTKGGATNKAPDLLKDVLNKSQERLTVTTEDKKDTIVVVDTPV